MEERIIYEVTCNSLGLICVPVHAVSSQDAAQILCMKYREKLTPGDVVLVRVEENEGTVQHVVITGFWWWKKSETVESKFVKVTLDRFVVILGKNAEIALSRNGQVFEEESEEEEFGEIL